MFADDDFLRELQKKTPPPKKPAARREGKRKARPRSTPPRKRQRKGRKSAHGDNKIVLEIMNDPDFSAVHEQIKGQIDANGKLLKKIKTSSNKLGALNPAVAELEEAARGLKNVPAEVSAKIKANVTKVVGAVRRTDKKLGEYAVCVQQGTRDLQRAINQIAELAKDRRAQEREDLERKMQETDFFDEKGRPYFIPKTIHYGQLQISLSKDKSGIRHLAETSLFNM